MRPEYVLQALAERYVFADELVASVHLPGHICPHIRCYKAERFMLLPQDICRGEDQLPELPERNVPGYDSYHWYLDGRVRLLVHIRLQRQLLSVVDVRNQPDNQVCEHA